MLEKQQDHGEVRVSGPGPDASLDGSNWRSRPAVVKQAQLRRETATPGASGRDTRRASASVPEADRRTYHHLVALPWLMAMGTDDS